MVDLGHVNEHLKIRQQAKVRIDYYLLPLKGQTQDRTKDGELIFSITSTMAKFYSKPHVLRYVKARLQYYNINGIVKSTGLIEFVSKENELIKKIYNLKTAVSTSKRMITKISNKINLFEQKQKELLINDLDNPKYLKLKKKLENYKTQLENNEKELKKEQIKQFKKRLQL